MKGSDDVSKDGPGKGDKKVLRLAGFMKRRAYVHFCLHSRLSVYYRVYSVKIMKIPKQDVVQDCPRGLFELCLCLKRVRTTDLQKNTLAYAI